MIRVRLFAKGFSLIEAAIVLGIIGLVIGGIWVASASVQKSLRIETTIEAIAMGYEKALSIYKSMPGGSVSFASIIGNKMPGGYTPDVPNGSFRRGAEYLQVGIISTLDPSDPPYYFTTYLPNWAYPAAALPVVDVCIKISQMALSLDLGRAPSVASSYASIMWNGASGAVAQWNTGTTKPTLADVSSYCATTTTIYIFRAL